MKAVVLAYSNIGCAALATRVPCPSRPLREAERAALGGTEEEWREAAKEGRRAGCTGEADRLLMGDASVIEASGVKTPDLVREVLWDPRSTDSPASREATAAYIACMTRAGYAGLPDVYEQPEQFNAILASWLDKTLG